MKTILQKQILLVNRNEESHFFQQKMQAAKAFVLVGSVLLLSIGTAFAQDFRITFAGKTEAKVNSKITTIDKAVESIIVQNLTQNITKTINGSDILYLNPTGVASGTTVLHELINCGSTKLLIYPNPSIDKSTLTFNLPESGVSSVAINDLSGKMISYYTNYLETGAYKFQLPGLKSGIYIVSVNGINYRGVEKLVSLGAYSSNYNLIQNLGKTSIELVESQKSPMQKVMQSKSAAPVGLKFNTGDKLMIKCVSGRDTTIIMDTPLRTKEVEVLFVDCIDADNNSYPVVKIGSLYWMTRNLMTTRFNNTSYVSIPSNWSSLTATSQACCYFGDDSRNKTLTGMLYTYNAAIGDVKPSKFRLPSRAEFKEMVNYLGDSITAGAKLKSNIAKMWTTTATCDNSTGFNAIASGNRLSTGFSNSGIVASFWTNDSVITNTNNAYSYELRDNNPTAYITIPVPKQSGLAVRCVYQPLDSRVAMIGSMFPSLGAAKQTVDTLPIQKNTIIMSNDKELFFSSHLAGSNAVQLGLIDNPSATSYTLIPGFANIGAGEVQWWDNMKKASSMTNENGRENIVMAVWNEAKLGYYSGTGKITLHIIGDKSINYLNTTKVLDGDFYFPDVWDNSGKPNPGMSYNNWARGSNSGILSNCQWEMELKCGDVNDDGVQDFLVALHDRLRVYSGKDYSIIGDRSFADDLNLTTNQAFSLRVQVTDIDKNGKNDVLVLTSSNMSNSRPKLHIFLNGDINTTNNNLHYIKEVSVSGTTIVTATFAVGDINGDKTDEIVYGVTASDKKQYVTYNTFAKGSFSAFKTLYRVDTNDQWISGITLARLKGSAGPNYILTNNRIVDLNTSGEFEMPFGDKSFVANNNNYQVFGDQIAVGNFDKASSGRDMVYFLFSGNDSGDLTKLNAGLDAECMYIDSNNAIQMSYTNARLTNANSNLNIGVNINFPVIAAVNTSHTGRVLQFDHYQYMLTKPQVDAVLAAAPYYKDWYTGSNGPSTSWGSSSSSSSDATTGVSVKASMSVGFEHEFDLPLVGIKIGSIEFTDKVTLGLNSSFSTAVTTTRTITRQSQNEDAVVVSSVPYDCYFYKILKSERPSEIGSNIMISFPRTPISQMLTVDSYNKLVEGQDAPIIDKTVLTHTVGDPTTYPNSTTSLSNMPSDKKFVLTGTSYTGVGNTGGVSMGIDVSTVKTNTVGFTYDREFELVGTVADVKLGAGFGYGASQTFSNSIGNSISVEGYVPGVSPSAPSTVKRFDWNIVWYNYMKTGQIFSVVNYLVK